MFFSVIALGAKIFPLYINIALGFISAKKLGISRQMIAPLIVYILSPVVVLGATLRVKIDSDVILIPLVIFALAAGLCFGTLNIARRFWSDKTKNLIAFSAGTGNTGYFGIPLAYILLPENVANIYVLALVMSFLYEYTIGFYIISRGLYTFAQSMLKIAKLPVAYAAIIGLGCNLAGVELSENFIDYLDAFRGAYITLGMMMVGMGLVGIRKVGIDVKFTSALLFSKFIVWPLAAILLAFVDGNFLHILSDNAYQVIFVYSIVPMAANTAIMATLFDTRPEQTSFTILISTFIAFFTIPIMAAWWL